jgi:hypothetical protein
VGIDDDDVNRGVSECAGGGDAPEPGPDDDDAMATIRGRQHGGNVPGAPGHRAD